MKLWKAMTLAGLLALGVCVSPTLAVNTSKINGSIHDFSSTIGGGQLCQPCHAPHGVQGTDANGNIKAGPLWNHTMSTAVNGAFTYSTYDANGLQTTTAGITLDNNTMLCMSCHDGTVALDSYGGASNVNSTYSGKTMKNAFPLDLVSQTAGDISGNHPIGTIAKYPTNDGVTASATYMNNPSNWTTGVAGSSKSSGINLKQIAGQTGYFVGCTSCHEPHNRNGLQHLLRVDNTVPQILDQGTRFVNGSGLCLSCHLK